MKSKVSILLCCIVISFISCSKDSDQTNDPDKGSLEGQIIYEYGSNVKTIDLKSGDESLFFSYNSYSTNSWDLSIDGKLRLISERVSGTIVETRFMLVNVADGTIIREFNYVPLVGNNQNYSGKLSYDGSLILLDPDLDNGIVIMDTYGKVKYRLDGINNEALNRGDEALWLPDNSIVIRFNDKYLLKAAPPYTNLALIKEMNYEEWGNMRVSRDGKKISLYIGNHIYLMNIDGSDLKQITESNGTENLAEFSPDGRYLLVGANYVHAPASGSSNWLLKIIPADGKKYDVDNSPEVIPVIPNNTTSIVKAAGVTLWRP